MKMAVGMFRACGLEVQQYFRLSRDTDSGYRCLIACLSLAFRSADVSGSDVRCQLYP